MNDLDPTIVDERGRAAAAALRAAAADRPVPTFDPDVVRIAVDAPTRRARRNVGLLAVAAALLVVVAATAILVSRPDRPSSTAPADGGLAPQGGRLQLGEVPDGFTLTSAEDVDPAQRDQGPPTSVYGTDEAHPQLIVAALPEGTFLGGDCATTDDEGECAPQADGTPGEVAGLDPVEWDAGIPAWELGEAFGPNAVVVEVDGVSVILAGAPLSRDDLGTAVAGVEIEGDRAVIADASLFGGLVDLGTVPLLRALGPAAGTFTVTRGGLPGATWLAAYERSDVEGLRDGSIVVSIGPGTSTDVGLGRVYADEATDVTVRGADGVLARFDQPDAGSTSWTVRWSEPAGQVVELGLRTESVSVSGDEVLALAEGLTTVDDADLVAIDRAEADRGLDAPGVTILGEGTFSNGTPWRLVHGLEDGMLPESGLDLRVEVEPSGSIPSPSASSGAGGTSVSSGGPVVGLGTEMAVVDGSELAWGYGPVTDDAVASVAVLEGDELLADAVVIRYRDLAGWVAELPADLIDEGSPDGLFVVAYDAAGAELGRWGF